MTELTVHEDSTLEDARERVRGFVDVGDDVEVYREVMTRETNNRISGTVATLEEDFFGIETDPGDLESLEYTEVDRVVLISED